MKRPGFLFFALCAFFVVTFGAAGANWLHISPDRLRRPCEVGRQQIYRLGFVSYDSAQPQAMYGSQRGAQSEQDYHLRLSGVLTVTTAACEPGGSLQLWNVVQPSIALDSTQAGSFLKDALASDLARPYGVRVETSGRVSRFAPDPAVGELGANFMRRLVATLQLVRPVSNDPLQTTWRADEPDVAGTRTSTYEIGPWLVDPLAHPAIHVHRTYAMYSQPARQARVIRHLAVSGIADDTETFRPGGDLQSIDHTYAETSKMGARIVSHVQQLVHVDLLATPRLKTSRDAAIAAYASRVLSSATAVALDEQPSEAQTERAGFTHILGKDTIATVSRTIAATPADADASKRGTLSDKLSSLFYIHPDSVAHFVAAATHAAPGSTTFAVVIQALGRVGSPAAQAGLIALLRARAGEGQAGGNAAVVLGLVEKPIAADDAALEHAVETGSSETQNAAELALGTIAASVATTDPARTQRLADRIRQRLASARTPAQRDLELLALGNVGDPQSLETIATYARSESLQDRADAATALAHEESSQADEILGDLLGDRASTVRMAAAQAFDQRNPGDAAYPKLEMRALHDPDPNVRSASIKAVLRQRADHPDALALGQTIARDDRDRNVRRAAQSLLDADPSVEDPNTVAPMDAVLGNR